MDPYNFILDTLKGAGELLLRLRSEAFETSTKNGDPRDIVTSVDVAVNEYITHKIQEQYPDHAIHSEEAAESASTSTHMWTIDPIDGSSNFSRGIPHFAICLGLMKEGVPVAGGILNPVTNELFSFERGKGAFLNGEPIKVSSIHALADAFVLLHTGRVPELASWGADGYKALLGKAKKTANFGSTALDTCFVAAGRVEASVYGTLSTLDIAPAIGLLQEAGGMIVNEDGLPLPYVRTPQKTYAVNNPQLFEALRTIV